jgi:hypothetical protein
MCKQNNTVVLLLLLLRLLSILCSWTLNQLQQSYICTLKIVVPPQVREDIDHRSYMPAAWRVDAYLNEEGEGEDDDDLASLRQHK